MKYLLGFLTFLFFVENAFSIPAFARKYQYSCTTCHAPAPRLKPFGEDFADRGFRLEDPSQEPTRATIDTGDPLLKLIREFPLAVRVDGFASYKEDAEAETDFQWPWAFKILSGGVLSEKVSYYFYYIIEKGGESGLEDAYLQFNKPLGLPFNLLFGQFQISDPLFKRELRLERNDYMIYKVSPGYSSAKLTYDRGVMVSSSLGGGIDFVLGIFNGSGLKEATGEGNDYDIDKEKSFSLRFAKEFGPVRFGLFGYYGKEKKAMINDFIKNKFYYYGPDLVIDFSENFYVNLQYLKRKDDKGIVEFIPDGASLSEMETDGGFLEIVWLPKGLEGRWAYSILYNKINSDDKNSVYENISLTMNYLIARNIRFLAEIENDLEKEKFKLSIGISSAF
jgi:hypothetical protein